MKDLQEHKKIAVLIDADNAQYNKLKLVLDEISVHGHIIVKRAYGDWSSEYLKNWKTSLNQLAIQPIQQFAYTVGKNSTDASMIIDAMDLLYTGDFDAFALVSSDSDFTKLASRLRESQMFVFGFGEQKTPVSFRNACDDFIYTENLVEELSIQEDQEIKVEAKAQYDELYSMLIKAWEMYKDDDGWANVAAAGSYIKRSKSDFDPRSYGAQKLSDIIKNVPDDFRMKKYKGKGKTHVVFYQPVVKAKKPSHGSRI